MYKPTFEKKLKQILRKLYKKDRKIYEIIMKKIENIVRDPHHCKPLAYDMKGLKRVHISGSFVLVFKIEENKKIVKFADFDHHDKIYKKK
jgi:YafQ family addiction module toxin component